MKDLSSYQYSDSGYSDGSIKSEPSSPSSGTSSHDHSPPLSPVPVSPVSPVSAPVYNLVTSLPPAASQTALAFNNINIPQANVGKVPIPKLVKTSPVPASVVTSNVSNRAAAPLVFVCNQTPNNGQIIVKTEPVTTNNYCSPMITGKNSLKDPFINQYQQSTCQQHSFIS